MQKKKKAKSKVAVKPAGNAKGAKAVPPKTPAKARPITAAKTRPHAEAPQSHSARLVYLYGFSPAGKAGQLDVEGVDGSSPVESIALDGMVAWISRGDAKEFGEELSSRMESLEWLADAGVHHQRAVAAINEQSTILPVRFGTVFLTEKTLAAHAAENAKVLQAGFRRVRDCEEWGVKVFVERQRPERVVAASGSDYLKQKADALRTQIHSPQADEALARFAADIQKVAREIGQTGKVSGSQPGLLWQASCLLPRAKRSEWEALMKRWAHEWADGRRIELTGPWPPYSFV